jgi:hypothetical protein
MFDAVRPTSSSAPSSTSRSQVASRRASSKAMGMGGWLPGDPSQPSPESLRSWQAPSLTEKGVDQRGLTYVVLEEIVGDTVGFSLYSWPAADPEGRLRFETDRRPFEVTVTFEEICGFLERRQLRFVARSTGRSEDRELRIGDVFAVRLDRPAAGGREGALAGWREVYDISADAREVAKLAYYGALTEKWEWKHARDLLLTTPPGEEA